ncbi:hypothetical protein [Bacteroides faecium]|uniref:DUF3592 domain-containing protein n=1 Tax=Bacteroides faecium TaxID=2715212 RepID=A0A6H0KQ95_9BACE|nr:hypothetical protein [Bacteroides faecium]QIU95560.1 hypothetical protein BacF7301_15990 [Bacteroides faecium]
MKALIYITMFLMSGIWFASCRTQYVPVETVRTEYKTRDSIRVDSIYNQDSIYVLVKGDTIYQYRYKYLYKYQYLNRTDTVIKIDSVQVPYPVEKQLSRWQSIKQDIGGIAIGMIVALLFIIVWLLRRKK